MYEAVAKEFETRLMFTKFSIDDPDNMAFVQNMGVLNEGIPSVRFYDYVGDAGGKGVMTNGQLFDLDDLAIHVEDIVHSFPFDRDGEFYLKLEREEDEAFDDRSEL